MLNQTLYRSSPVPAVRVTSVPPEPAAHRINPERIHGDWCVGDTPVEWDVSFGDRLIATFRRLFSRAQSRPPLKIKPAASTARRIAA